MNITINGTQIEAKDGDTILEAASRNGISIPSLCWHKSVSVYGSCGVCLVEVEGNPKLLRSCATKAAEGMTIHTETPRVIQARRAAIEFIMSDHTGDCIAPCVLNCPGSVDCQEYIKQTALGDYTKAVSVIKTTLPMPASIGRVCPHPCEQVCRRRYVDEPMAISYLKYFAADKDLASGSPWQPQIEQATGKSVGIAGGGPAGLTAAYYLAAKGHSVTVYDAMPQMGGMLRYGIPEYRLPKAVLDKEISLIESMGVVMQNNVHIGGGTSLEELKARHDAVLVAPGAWTSTKLGCEGEDANGVLSGIDFLKDVALGERPMMGKRVAVVGGGNTAMDACRTAVRIGAKKVYLLYRRSRWEMPAEDIEISETIEEGVTFKYLVTPAEIISNAKKGPGINTGSVMKRVKAIKLQVMELGEADATGRRSPVPIEGKFETLEVDTVIAAIGQKLNTAGFENLRLNKKGSIEADENSFMTSVEGIFAAGDAVNKGADIAIAAIGEGRKAAESIDAFLRGKTIQSKNPYLSKKEKVGPEDFVGIEIRPRMQMPRLTAAKRTKGRKRKKIQMKGLMPKLKPVIRKETFAEVNLGFTEEQAIEEATRCLECGCHDYGECRLIKTANIYKIHPERITGPKHKGDIERKLICIERDNNKCILCGLCVRACYELAGEGIIDLQGRGSESAIKPEFATSEDIAVCRDCLKCESVCPTGALRVIENADVTG